jgi:hypothetical protein
MEHVKYLFLDIAKIMFLDSQEVDKGYDG